MGLWSFWILKIFIKSGKLTSSIVWCNFRAIRKLCFKSESGKWFSALENTLWFENVQSILKGAVRIMQSMKVIL